MTGQVQRIGLACIAAAFVADQASKAVALAFAAHPAAGIEVLPIFNLVLTHNRGASFGLFGGLPWWALVLIGLMVSVVLSGWPRRTYSRLTDAALGLVIGGALGNALDRVRRGAVTDFLDFHIGTYHWPAFNLADLAIVGGVGSLLVRGIGKQPA